ncbi:GNAT family N-acyltransferase [Actinomadura harenae]|uniref:GNAT family N-acyltransferase n=1 Tax=Actinomadura harenae TaxID=2483351 RepID=UPI0013154898|nr:GNAT family N-acyltransferase [Actinomadura harenae]
MPPLDGAGGGYLASAATSEEQIKAARDLWHWTYHLENGLPVNAPGRVAGFAQDADHLIVTDTSTGAVVGTCQLFEEGVVEQRFLLGLPRSVTSSMIQLGRFCVDPGHRSGAVFGLLAAEVGRYLVRSGHRYVVGCLNVFLPEGHDAALNMWELAVRDHAPPEGLSAEPRVPWDVPRDLAAAPSYRALPPLARFYLRCGVWILGDPAYVKEVDSVCFCFLVDTDNAAPLLYRCYFPDGRGDRAVRPADGATSVGRA